MTPPTLPRVTRPVCVYRPVAPGSCPAVGWYVLDAVTWTCSGPYPTLATAHAFAHSLAAARASALHEASE